MNMRFDRAVTAALVTLVIVTAGVQAALVQSNGTGGGDWSAGATWNGGAVPGSGDSVQIVSGDTVNVDIFASPFVTDVTVDASGSLIGQGGILEVTGNITNNGTATDLDVIFFGTTAVTGTVEFIGADCQGTVDFGTASTVGFMIITSGTPVINNGPAYTSSSTLRYSNGTATTGPEWSGTGSLGTPGVPPLVQIFNGAVVNVSAGTHVITGDLDYGSSGNNTLNLGSATLHIGDDILAGDSNSVFNPGTGTVIFDGGGISAIQSALNPSNVSFGDVMVTSGTELRDNAGVTAAGLVTNEGTIRQTAAIASPGAVTFGLIPGVEVDVTTQGALTSLQVDWVGSNHPEATTTGQTGQHWTLTPDSASGTVVSLTLPHAGLADPLVCRHLSGPNFDCARDSFTASSVTRNGITGFSDWLVSDGAEVPVELSIFAAD